MTNPRCISCKMLAAAVLGLAMLAGAACNDDNPPPAPPPAYTQADLEGAWYLASFNVGPAVAGGSSVGWIRARINVEPSGNATATWVLDSAGNHPVPPSFSYAIAPDGVITASSTVLPAFRGRMDASKSLWVATSTLGTTGAQLRIYQKVVPGTAFSGADLASSTFTFHRFVSGTAPGWEHGIATLDAARLLSLSGIQTPAGPVPDVAGLDTLSLDADGLVTAAADPSWGGFMSADKGLLVMSTADTASRSYGLIVATRSGGAYATSDLAGSWEVQELGQSPTLGTWDRGTFGASAAGVFTFTTHESSTGPVTLPGSGTLAVAGDGTVTLSSPVSPAFHGSFAPGKRFIVTTDTGDTGAYLLQVLVKPKP